jgi:hypothetical protein
VLWRRYQRCAKRWLSRRAADVARVGGNGLSSPTDRHCQQAGRQPRLLPEGAAEDAAAFVDSVLTRGEVDNEWLLGAQEGPEGSKRLDDYGWWTIQARRLMANMDVADPEDIEEALAVGSYAGLDRALRMTQEEVISEVSGSKLSGRSGGFFPTGRKWDFLRTSPTTPKTMVCNADEATQARGSTA